MSEGKKVQKTVKKSISMAADLWEFIETMAGPYGENSKVVQDAVRQMRDNLKKSAKRDLEGGADKIKESLGKKK